MFDIVCAHADSGVSRLAWTDFPGFSPLSLLDVTVPKPSDVEETKSDRPETYDILLVSKVSSCEAFLVRVSAFFDFLSVF